jgi:tripartite-type tricarboxylate transporter receptor subunit TctC
VSINRLSTAFAIGATGVFISLCPVAAQNWPTKPVRIIVPYAAGGSADTLARIVNDPLAEVFHQQFYVENRGGAGGLIGASAAAHAAPDGSTLVVSGIASHVIAPAINSNVDFDPIRDFTHIAYFGGPPIVLVAHPSLGVHSLKELLALAHDGRRLGYVSPGVGTLGNLVAEYLARKENIKLDHIPYKGANPAVMDLIAGHVKLGSMTWTTAHTQIRAGALVPLAVTSAKRLAEFPDVPTLKELGYPELVATTWFALSGPAGMPKDITQRLNREIIKILERPNVRQHLAQEAMLTEPMTPEEFTNFVKDEIERWGPIAKAMPIQQ